MHAHPELYNNENTSTYKLNYAITKIVSMNTHMDM